jgi:hypothetical protein
MLLCRDRTMLRIAGGALTMFGTWEWRERHGSAPCVIASEAKQSSFLRRPTRKLDCFVASLLAMTAGHTFSFPQLVFARVVAISLSLSLERAQGKPGADCARSPVCEECYRNAHGFNYRYSRDIPAFPAQWFYGLYVLSPGKRPFLPPLCGSKLPQVAPGSRRQDHTISPYAIGVFVR